MKLLAFLFLHLLCFFACSLICLSIENMLVLDGNLKSVYSSRKNYYKSQRSQMCIPFKKRKLFNCSSSDTNSNGYIRSDDTCYSPKNDTNQSVSCSSSGMSQGFTLNDFLPLKLILWTTWFNCFWNQLLNKFQIFDACYQFGKCTKCPSSKTRKSECRFP